LVLGCGGDGATGSGQNGAGGAPSAGIGGAWPGQGSSSSGDLFNPSVGAGGDGGLDPDAACAASSYEASVVPVNMFIMFDRSGSMIDKWAATTGALIAFFEDPGSAGLRVALRFFPDSGCHGASCDVLACSQPLVSLGELTSESGASDPQETALISAVNSKVPDGGTPMYAALAGAEQWAVDHQNANPSEKTVVVLVTDGQPNGCDEDIDNISQLASDARSSNGVLTYAVGLVGSHQDQMDKIAQAGGTSQGFFIGNGNAQADLLAALKSIQGGQLDCQFVMPSSKNGDPVDPAYVNVTYAPGGGTPKTLGQLPSKSACAAKEGWYYDDPKNPSKIVLCPSTCSSVKGDTSGKIEILLGCATKPAD